MPNPADSLPAELFRAVLDLALYDETDTQRLCSLALLGRSWRAALLGPLYSEWTYNGARQSFMTLWKFIRTVNSQPRIAALVRTLNAGNWGFYPGAATGGPPRKLPLRSEERELIHDAIQNAELGDLEPTIVDSILRRDRRPLMAILLSCLPNLSTVYVHVPPSDPILETFLKRTLGCQMSDKSSGFSGLRELHLLPEIPVPSKRNDCSDDELSEDSPNLSLRLDYLWPVFYLKGLRSLSLFDLDPRGAADYLGSNVAPSQVENLHLVAHWGSVFTLADTKALLSQPDRLRSISLYLPDKIYDERTQLRISNTEIWDCLQKHKYSLETIDIYRDAAVHRDEKGHFGILREFTFLKNIRIQVEVLLGGCCDSPPAPFRLQDTLPSSVETLTLYGKEGYYVVSSLPDQLKEVVSGDFPSLMSITLEALECVVHNDRTLREPYKVLEGTCNQKSVILRVEEPDQLPKGGSRRELWRKTLYMRDDGDQRYEAVSYIPRNLRDSRELLLRSADDAESDEYHDEMSRGENEYGPHVGGRLTVHTVPFTDHLGNAAYMVFENLESFPLPPLFSFAIYFTHPDAAPESCDMAGLHEELTSQYGGGDFDGRFDMYLLPSASLQDCISHYRGEKITRGSYRDQVRSFEQCDWDEVHPVPGTYAQVPGTVGEYYMAEHVLYVCSEKDWHEGQRTLCVVKFDEQDDADTPSPFRAKHRPMTKETPTYDLVNPLNPTNETPVDEEMYEIANWDRDTWLGAWQKATSRGWTGW